MVPSTTTEEAIVSQRGGEPQTSSILRDTVAAALLGVCFFALLCATSWISSGFDAYRHVRIARSLTENASAVFQDPWRLAYLWPKPVDAWFGYHVLLAPFTRIFDLVIAAKVLGALVFASIAFVLLRLLAHLEVPYRYFWVLIALAGSSITLNRATTCRPFLFSILLVLTTTLLTFKRKAWAVAIVSAVHAVAYSIFFLVAITPGVWLLCRRDRQALRNAIACGLGIAAGLLLNPYFPENVRFDIVQARITAIAAKAHVEIGHELDPMQPGWWFLLSLPIVIFWSAALVTRIRQRRTRTFGAHTDVLLIISILALIGALQVGRTYDYFVPFAVLFSAVVLKPWVIGHRRDLPYVAFLVSLVCAAHVFLAYSNSFESAQIHRYRDVAAYLRVHAPNEIVTNAEWGEYHYLYFWNPQSRYFIGFEPTFVYLTDARKYWLWRHISNNEASTCDQESCEGTDRRDIASAIKDELHSTVLVTNHGLHSRVEESLRKRDGVTEVYRDPMESVFRISY